MRRRLLAALGTVPLLAACGIGRRGSAYYDGPVTDHFDGRRFRNPGGEAPRGFTQLLRWQLGESGEAWPEAFPSPFPPARPPPRVERGPRVTLVGHATFLIQGGGLNILTDPVWSDRVSPVSFTGPRRVNPPGIAFEDLPPIHAALVSHAHYDHMDTATLTALRDRHGARIVAPLGNDAIIGGAVTTADWGDTVDLGHGARATLVPVHHWSARGLGDRNHALCSGAAS